MYSPQLIVNILHVKPQLPHLHANLPLTVPENTPVGTVIAQLPVTDADANSGYHQVFLLAGGHHFAVSAAGALSVQRPLDRELTDRHSLELVATDGRYLTHAAMTISVTDVNGA